MSTCSTCGAENRDGARFCDACGAPLSAPSPSREQRKTVTVLFSDVTGSTALGERLDPESLRHVMTRYFETSRGVIERHGGTVEKFIGDAVMAVFGVPVVHEDDALRAVRAAAELREALAGLNEELAGGFGTTLAVRIGVNTGEVVTGTEESLATGDAVNVAARLEQAAEPGEILLGAETVRLARDAIEAQPVEPLALKGKAEPVEACRLVRVDPDAAAHARRFDAPIVGRQDELSLLVATCERSAHERACHLLTLLGPAGVGKSRLVLELLSRLDGATVVRGQCLPYGEGITYWPVVNVLKQVLGDDLAALETFGLDARAVEAIRSVLGDETVFASAEEIAWAVRKLLESVAASAPLVVVLDDLHWGEETFLDLVEHVADLARDAPIVLLCMGRQELLDRRPGWGGGKLNATTVLLEPLSGNETSVLIDELLGGEEIDESLRARIHDAAEGNPLFVEEMVAMLRESPRDVVVVPPTIHALLAARLDQLDPADRGVLERGAVEGRVFHRGAVEALGPEEQVGARLTSLVRKELVRPDRAQIPGDDAFRFRHLLIRDAAYDALPKTTRADLHERFANWLEVRGAGLVELDEILGYHLEQAYRYRAELGPVNDAAKTLAARASRLLGTSGRKAHERGDVGAAIVLLERAWSLSASDPPDVDLALEFANAIFTGGRLAEALELMANISEQAGAAGDVVGELWAEVERTRFASSVDPSTTAAHILSLVERARPIFQARGHERALASAAAAELWAENSLLHTTRVAEAAARLAEHARRAGDRRREIDGLTWTALADYLGSTPVAEALRRWDEDPALDDVIALRRSFRAHLLAMLGRFDEARTLIGGESARFRERGDALHSALVRANEGLLELLAGDDESAERTSREACEAFETVGETGFLSTSVAYHGQALYGLGRLDEADAAAARGRELTAADDILSQLLWRQLRAKVLARRGEHDEAVRLVTEVTALTEGIDSPLHEADAALDVAEVLELAGRPDDAAVQLERALELYERKGSLVMAQRTRERLAALRGDS